MDNEVTFNQVKEALEIASRIEKIKNQIHQRKLDMTFKEDAAHRVRVDDVGDYVMLDRLGKILYEITKNSDSNWKGTAITDCINNMKYYTL